ncbi:MAG TPA: hypothetical protein PLE45_10690 [Spirochaetota bacterium]|nr:hypothetical protein [Spirochaetota bacterium]HOL57552.1 hypothetical protein [Spirochaetota bacterium]HPP05115.1 hypothetical protein [Spirochaetota bacterium]
MSEDKKKILDLLEINYRRAAINIGYSIINKLEIVDTPEKLVKEIESAINDYKTLLENYKKEKEETEKNKKSNKFI